jgi:hypothetical protein
MRHVAIVIIAVAATALYVRPAAASQFDLLCVGTRDTGGGPQPYSIRYRVDLDAMRWCADDCASPQDIQNASPDRITFYDEPAANPDGSQRWRFIDRTTGALSQMEYAPSRLGPQFTVFENITADCKAAPFSGMPAARF